MKCTKVVVWLLFRFLSSTQQLKYRTHQGDNFGFIYAISHWTFGYRIQSETWHQSNILALIIRSAGCNSMNSTLKFTLTSVTWWPLNSGQQLLDQMLINLDWDTTRSIVLYDNPFSLKLSKSVSKNGFKMNVTNFPLVIMFSIWIHCQPCLCFAVTEISKRDEHCNYFANITKVTTFLLWITVLKASSYCTQKRNKIQKSWIRRPI